MSMVLATDTRDAVLHNVSSLIVRRALQKRQAIIMEDLQGLKSSFSKESMRSAEYLSRMNAWPFGRLRIQVFYKAMWEGVQEVWVDPQGTSNECSNCGGGMIESPELHPMVRCRVCGLVINRDLNSARIIVRMGVMKLGLRSGQAGAGR